MSAGRSWNARSSWRVIVSLAAVPVVLLLTPDAANAYGGPGSIVSGVGALLAAIAAIGAALFGFFWFPIKRLIRKLRDGERGGAAGPEAGEELAPE